MLILVDEFVVHKPDRGQIYLERECKGKNYIVIPVKYLQAHVSGK